jgi:hypothetical protein
VEFAGASEGLSPTDVSGAFSGVVYDDDGTVKSLLNSSQRGEDGSDSRGKVFVDAGVESDKGVEDEERGVEFFDGIEELEAFGFDVQMDGGSGNDP